MENVLPSLTADSNSARFENLIGTVRLVSRKLSSRLRKDRSSNSCFHRSNRSSALSPGESAVRVCSVAMDGLLAVFDDDESPTELSGMMSTCASVTAPGAGSSAACEPDVSPPKLSPGIRRWGKGRIRALRDRLTSMTQMK